MSYGLLLRVRPETMQILKKEQRGAEPLGSTLMRLLAVRRDGITPPYHVNAGGITSEYVEPPQRTEACEHAKKCADSHICSLTGCTFSEELFDAPRPERGVDAQGKIIMDGQLVPYQNVRFLELLKRAEGRAELPRFQRTVPEGSMKCSSPNCRGAAVLAEVALAHPVCLKCAGRWSDFMKYAAGMSPKRRQEAERMAILEAQQQEAC